MNKQRLPAHPYQSDGGEATHTLALAEMPSHDDGIMLLPIGDLNRTDKYPGVVNVGRDAARKNEYWTVVRYTETSGGGQAHNIMPPFIALYYCRRN
jgi:hypothetical protein